MTVDVLLFLSAHRGLELAWGQASAWAPDPGFCGHFSITINTSSLGNLTTCHKFSFFSRKLSWSIQNNFASSKSLGMYLQTCMQVPPCK